MGDMKYCVDCDRFYHKDQGHCMCCAKECDDCVKKRSCKDSICLEEDVNGL